MSRQKIPRRIHEATLLLGADFPEPLIASREALRRSGKAKSLNLLDEWELWGGVAAYLAIKDSGAEFEIVSWEEWENRR
jgi:hypothetical protein